MFSVACVILPFSDLLPADAIRESLARFERGARGDVPESWLGFDDETDGLRRAYEAQLVCVRHEKGGLRIKGGSEAHWYVDVAPVVNEMRAHGLQS